MKQGSPAGAAADFCGIYLFLYVCDRDVWAVAKLMGSSMVWVYRLAYRYGLPLRHPERGKRLSPAKVKYNLPRVSAAIQTADTADSHA